MRVITRTLVASSLLLAFIVVACATGLPAAEESPRDDPSMPPVKAVEFQHIVIDPDPAGWENDITLLADINGDGHNDVVIGGKRGNGNLVWYEYPSWKRHTIGSASLEAGGVIMDIARNGRPSIVAGEHWGYPKQEEPCEALKSFQDGKAMYWWECPEDPTKPWTMRLITNQFHKYHDQAKGDVDGDGEDELVFLSQGSRLLAYYDIPEDPRVEPWPESCLHIVDEGKSIEGLQVVDIDGDGRNEILCGTYLYEHPGDPTKPWKCTVIAEGWPETRAAVADLNGDGQLDIVICACESHPAKLSWFEGPAWKEHVLREDLFHAHSLGIADFNGDGTSDIFTAEMGLGRNPHEPKGIVYLNDGKGDFQEQIYSEGIPTHEAKAAVIGDGPLPSIVGKPYNPENHIDLWLNMTK